MRRRRVIVAGQNRVIATGRGDGCRLVPGADAVAKGGLSRDLGQKLRFGQAAYAHGIDPQMQKVAELALSGGCGPSG